MKENLHTTDREAVKANQPVRRAFYGQDFPATIRLQVSRLYEPSHMLEVELIAVFPTAYKWTCDSGIPEADQVFGATVSFYRETSDIVTLSSR